MSHLADGKWADSVVWEVRGLRFDAQANVRSINRKQLWLFVFVWRIYSVYFSFFYLFRHFYFIFFWLLRFVKLKCNQLRPSPLIQVNRKWGGLLLGLHSFSLSHLLIISWIAQVSHTCWTWVSARKTVLSHLWPMSQSDSRSSDLLMTCWRGNNRNDRNEA